MKLFRLTPVVISLVLAACATKPAPVDNGPDSEAYARKVIIEKVDAAVQAQRDLAAATAEGKEMLAHRQANLDGDEVDIDYIGKPQQLLEAIAYRYGYRYAEAGKRGELRTVNLRVQKQRVLEVLRDVGYQIDSGADVVVDKDAKIIRLVYKKG